MGYQLASVVAGGPAPLLAAWLLHTFNSSLPIAIYIMLGAVVTIVATALLPEPNREQVRLEFEQAETEAIPQTARASAGQMAGVSS
jgi:hypothetical protein